MSTTYSIDHVVPSTTVESVNVEVAAKSELTHRSTSVVNGETVAEYVLASGDINYPATVTYRSGLQTRKAGNKRRISVTFSTWAAATDSGTGLVSREEISSTISFLVPAAFTLELADIDDLLGNMFSFMYPSVSAGARNTGYLQKLLYGVPQVV